jgi:2-dehydro-3-deoxyphosphogluconate aldolase/(4S)-4-hydroxy-2-oxoglutarate aldolase
MLAALARYKIIPTLDVKELSELTALKTCEVLIENSLPVMEIPFRRHSDSLALKAIAKEFPGFLIGVSGIINSEQLLRAIECEVKFASSPGVCTKTLSTAAKQKLIFMPGASNPTDIQNILTNGFADFQFFPAEAVGGAGYLQKILQPFEHLPLDIFPKGGINYKSACEYLKIPHVTAVAIDDILKPEFVSEERWDKIFDSVVKVIDRVNR